MKTLPVEIPTPRTDEIRDKFRGDETGLCRELVAHANQLEREIEMLTRVVREDQISGRIIKAQNDRRGRIYEINRDAQFIIKRTEDVLRP